MNKFDILRKGNPVEIRSTNWWEAVDYYWNDLQALIDRFHPSLSSGYPAYDAEITAPGAEFACGILRSKINRAHPLQDAIEARKAHDGKKLHKIFNETWFGMPESVAVHGEPGFYALCDLCSEYED